MTKTPPENVVYITKTPTKKCNWITLINKFYISFSINWLTLENNCSNIVSTS